jgi:hypothetical protein
MRIIKKSQKRVIISKIVERKQTLHFCQNLEHFYSKDSYDSTIKYFSECQTIDEKKPNIFSL